MIRFSLVIAAYNVAPYLPDTFDSLTSQEPGNYELQVIFIDDGSTDATGDLLRQWAAGPGPAAGLDCVVLSQTNAGPSAARNHGLEMATGDWVSFPDADDPLSKDYFLHVSQFLETHHADPPAMIETKIWIYSEANDEASDTWAFRDRFEAGARVINLNYAPNSPSNRAANGFFQRAALEAMALRFEVGLNHSEDALFACGYLAAAPQPTIGLVPEARYYYRKRAAADSLTGVDWTEPELVKDTVDRATMGSRAHGGPS